MSSLINFGKGGKTQAPACGVSGKGPTLRLNDFSRVLTKPAQFTQSAIDPSQVRSKSCVIYTITRNSLSWSSKVVPSQGQPPRSFLEKVIPMPTRLFRVKVDPGGCSGERSFPGKQLMVPSQGQPRRSVPGKSSPVKVNP